MVSKSTSVRARPQPSLVFRFTKGRPIDAGELGKLFVCLARDYRRLTKRQLVVAQVEAGSLAVTDAGVARGAPVARATEAVDGMIGLARALHGMLEQGRRAGAKSEMNNSPGHASLAQFLKVVGKSGGEGQFEIAMRRGKIKARVTSGEAIEVGRRAKPSKQRKIENPPDLPMLVQSGERSVLVNQFGPVTESEVEGAIPALTTAIRRARLGFCLDIVANELDVRGFHRIAWAIRADIRRNRQDGR